MVESCAPCIPIRNNGSQIVDVRHLSAFLWWRFQPRIVMFPIMQLLRTEEAVDLIRNRGVRVISNVINATKGKCQKSTLHISRKEIELVERLTHPRSGPTSLLAVVSRLLAAHPETYMTSSHRAI